eukprot:597746-Alexandrium_andersonii.AAC.1
MTPTPPRRDLLRRNLRSFLGPRSSSSERLKQSCIFWVPYVARCPKRNPQSAQGPSVPQSASIRNPLKAHQWRNPPQSAIRHA